MIERGKIMNDVLKVLQERRSCRNFQTKMIPKKMLDVILEAGTYAPSGMGKQSPIIIAITNLEVRNKIARENGKIAGLKDGIDPFYGAPVILAVLADTTISTYLYDGSLVIGNMLNAAESLGLGSIWIHRAKEEFASEFGKNLLKELGITGAYEGIGFCALGYRDSKKPKAAKRKENYIYYLQ